jgi:hypothetical protein
MSDRRADLGLRLELLRLRGELQRAEAAAALADVRATARRARAVLGALAGLGRIVSGARAPAFDTGSMALFAAALRERPWLVPLAGIALKLARRHPWAVLAATAAALAARWLLRRAGEPATSGDAGAAARPRSGGIGA